EGSGHSTQRQAAVGVWFRQRVAERRSKRSREDVRRPEEHILRNAREEMRACDDREKRREHDRAALEAESCRRGDEIAERCSERVGNEDRDPIERLVRTRRNGFEFDLAGGAAPDEENE